MAYGETITLAQLRERAGRSRHRGLSSGASMLVCALDARMNSNTVLASLPIASGQDVADALATWLDAGAPGLREAAVDCDWDGHFEQVRAGPAPRCEAIDAAAFVAAIDHLLTRSHSFYAVTIAEPEQVRDAFLRDELGDPRTFRYYAVDVATLAVRVDYFEGLGNDTCLAWADHRRLRLLFTNGQD